MRIIVAFIFFSLCCWSCESDTYIPEIPEIPENGEIRFVVDAVSVRGSVITKDNISSMNVFCHTTGDRTFDDIGSTPDWMYKSEVSRVDNMSEWVTKPAPSTGSDIITNDEWKGSEYHSFFAISPYNVGAEEDGVYFSGRDDLGSTILHYTVPTLPSDHVDLLYASVLDVRYQYIGNKPIAFGFKHALSKVTFSVRKEKFAYNELQEVRIKSISFSNVWRSGKFDFTKDVNGLMTGNWLECQKHPKDNVFTTSVENKGLTDLLLTNEFQKVTATGGDLMVIPQDFVAAPVSRMPSTDDGIMTIVYNIIKKGDEPKEFSEDFKMRDICSSWTMGKSYNFNIRYDGDGFSLLGVTVEINDWDDKIIDGDTSPM